MKNLFLITAILINSVNLYPQDTLNLNFERPDKSSVIKLYGWSGTASVDSTTVFDGKYSIKISSGSDFKDVLFSKKIDIPQNSPFLLK